MKIVKSNEMKKIETAAVEKIGIRSLILMENAALNAAQCCLSTLKRIGGTSAVIFCGKGNNGGDGFALARQLFIKNIDVKAVLFGDIEKGSEDCINNYNIAVKMGISVLNYNEQKSYKIIDLIKKADLCVDALIGTGLKNALYSELNALVRLINENSKYTISVDIPTGIDADNGRMYSNAVSADETISFHCYKIGHFIGEGALRRGRLKLCAIGIAHGDGERDLNGNILTKNEAEIILPKREENSHKGSFGKVFVLSGSRSMTGAAFFNCSSAYAAGAGIVKLYSVKEAVDNLRSSLPEALTCTVKGKSGFLCEEDALYISDEINECSVIVAGSGMGKNKDTEKFLERITNICKVPMVLDADALNIMAQRKEFLSVIKEKSVVTPHLGEMSRLTGLSTKEISENMIETAVEFSKRYGVVTVLKDFRTVIANADGSFYINTTGCSAMAKGGSGDCLSGTIAGFIAQGLDCFKAAYLACFVNGMAGELARDRLGEYSVMARDIVENIPKALNEIVTVQQSMT